jgi:excisionase family DNA binding protein
MSRRRRRPASFRRALGARARGRAPPFHHGVRHRSLGAAKPVPRADSLADAPHSLARFHAIPVRKRGTMATVSLGQAARMLGCSKATVGRWIKSGKVSAAKTDIGGWLIDVSEIDRVRSDVRRDGDAEPVVIQAASGHGTGVDTALHAEVRLLREMLADRDETVRDLRHRLDAEVEERKRLTTMLLTDQRQKRRWWQRRSKQPE